MAGSAAIPYVSLTDFASQIAGEGEYDYDIAPYYVEQHYDYPRFVCYDCHNYVSYSYWDPYNYSCNRFRIVIYDDYYYYPYRYYSNAVIVRPYRPGPRYVFKDYDGRDGYVTRVRQRPTETRVSERDRTSADVGGRGSIPAPVEPRRRAPATPAGRDASPVRGSDPTGGASDSPRRRSGTDAAPAADPKANSPRRRSPDSRDQGSSGIAPRDDVQPGSRGQDPPRRRTGPSSQSDQSSAGSSAGSRRPSTRDQGQTSGSSSGSSSTRSSDGRRSVDRPSNQPTDRSNSGAASRSGQNRSGSSSGQDSRRPSADTRRPSSGSSGSAGSSRPSSRPQSTGQPTLRRRPSN